MKDLVGNELSLGDKCYYIHNNKNGWNLAIVEVVEFKAKTLIVKFVDVNPSEEYESKNYYGWYGEGDLSKDFKINKAPYQQDNEWRLILDGEIYTRH